MAPLPQETTSQSSGSGDQDVPFVPNDDDIVITGISGQLPDCASYMEFADKIYQKKNLVTSSPRWKNIKHPELPEQCGRISDLDVFDAQFFTVFHKLAHSTEPLARKLFEQTYQAIFDAGISPMELWGKKVGVFISAELSETEKMCSDGVPLAIVGCCRSMYANRISYWLNLKGPSITMDGSDCGALLALEKAREAIAKGYCDEAIVGCGKLLLHPQTVIIYNRTMRTGLNFEGVTKCYDDAADGQSMSEAVNVLLLQKYKHAKRAYAVLRHVKAHFSAANIIDTSEKFQIPRDVPMLTEFFSQFYDEAGVPPSAVEYVEGFGAACQTLDKLELQAMEQVFCKARSDALLVGSVASNIGYTEAASAACAIFKILAAYQRGIIPATIHCNNPRRDVTALHDGRMSIVTENTLFRRTFTAVNTFSVTGINGHALLQGCYKPKDPSKYPSEIPYLVAVSGRQEVAVKKILDDIKSRPLDPEEIALIHNFQRNRISNHLSRGFGVYSSENSVTTMHTLKVDYYDDVRRPLWFVYSGMGSQWVGMGRQLMRIPIFNKAIQRCHKVLVPKGVDLIDIITSTDDKVFDNILHSFVGIAAIQIGLTDILTAIGLVPDKIIGHSLGELGCAYVDGCFSAEEMMQLAYTRGLVSIQTPFVHGSMAAVGMGYKSISKICPPEIDVACHNSADSCTISGPAEAVKAFVEVLTKQGLFAKEVKCSNIPYHSRYISNAGPEFLRMLRQVVKEPKLRSAKWVSTSVPQEDWNEDRAKYSSAEYHTNNLLNKVLFEEALRHVPSNAVLVEIAPHGLLQAILKRALFFDCRHVALTLRGHKDNALFLLEAIGKLFMEGYDMNISALYPKIEFPVSSETRPLSHLVEWAHGEKWKICEYLPVDRSSTSILKQLVTVEDDDNKYLNGHYVEGVRVYPYAAALVAVWDTLAMTNGCKKKETSVQFTNVKLHSQPPLRDHKQLRLTVAMQRGSGRFEVFTDTGVIVDGHIFKKKVKKLTLHPEILSLDIEGENLLNQEDIYKLLQEKGLEYKDEFRSVHIINTCMTHAEVQWRNNWVTFIDGVLQTCLLRNLKDHGMSELNFIRKMVINVKAHFSESVNGNTSGLLRASHFSTYNRTRCGGVTINDVFCKSKPLTTIQSIELKTLKFQPFYQKDSNDVTTSIYTLMQVINEHVNRNTLNVYYVNVSNRLDYLSELKSVIKSPPLSDTKIVIINKEELLKTMSDKPDVIFMHDLLSDKTLLHSIYKFIAPNTLLISTGVETDNLYPTSTYKPIVVIGSGRNKFELAIFRSTSKPSNTTAVSVRSQSDYHNLRMICNELPKEQKLLVLTSYPAPLDLKSMMKHLRCNNQNASMVMFDQNNSMNKELENIPDVPFCALRNDVWGSDYYVPTKPKNETAKESVVLRCKQPGNVDTLSWEEVHAPTGPAGVEVIVHYAGLSVRDAQRAMAEIVAFTSDSGFGMDFSGVTARGERVMGLIAEGAAASKVQANPLLLWPVPDHWSLEDAATVPLAYAHAFYCLAIKFTMMKGMTVLVHGGAGGLGQAAISIALAHGCHVFTTVSDLRKKRFLKKLFPALKDDHIGNSRDDSFVDMIRKTMKNQVVDGGCNIVIGHATGDIKNNLLCCAGSLGFTIDVTQVVKQDNFAFGMEHLVHDRSYCVTDLSSIFKHNNSLDMRKLQLLISAGIERGYVRPLTRVTYEPHETPRAFRLLAASRHRGRALLALQPRVPLTRPRLSCRPDRSYLIVCDSEGLGFHLADTLINRGATRIHLHCQESSYMKYKLEIWEQHGVQVDVSSDSIADKEGVLRLLTNCIRSGAIDDIYVMATDEGVETTATSLVAKLDVATRRLCPDIRHFAVISEDDKLWRNIIVKRKLDGLPSLSLQLHKTQKFKVQSQLDEESETAMVWRNTVGAIEAALTSGDTVVLAHVQPASKLSLLEELAKIPGVNITNATVDRTTLEQVGVDQGRAQEVRHLIEKKLNMAVSGDMLPAMTIAQLKKLEEQTKKDDIEQDGEGFAAYFSSVEPDELFSTTELVIMRTLVHKTQLRADEFETDRDYLCVLPGLEGHYARFETLCERLKIPAVVLQLDHQQRLDDTLAEIAQKIANTIMQKLKPKQSFYLLGYDFGVLVALEMAAILERNGLTGTVYMLGGTPQDICNSFNYRWKGTTPEAMQDALITHMYTLITGAKNINLENMLRNTTNWTDKVNHCIKSLRSEVSYSTQYISGVIEGAYARIKLLQNYVVKQHNLRSKLVLLRAKLETPEIDDPKLFHEGMEVHDLRAALAHATKDLATSNYINRYLDKGTLEGYENSNQCNTVITNSDFIHLKLVDHPKK